MLRTSAARELEMLDPTQRAAVITTLQLLADSGSPVESEQIARGVEYRLRSSDCVLIYSIDGARSRIVVASVRPLQMR